jgi:hypothetical protein
MTTTGFMDTIGKPTKQCFLTPAYLARYWRENRNFQKIKPFENNLVQIYKPRVERLCACCQMADIKLPSLSTALNTLKSSESQEPDVSVNDPPATQVSEPHSTPEKSSATEEQATTQTAPTELHQKLSAVLTRPNLPLTNGRTATSYQTAIANVIESLSAKPLATPPQHGAASNSSQQESAQDPDGLRKRRASFPKQTLEKLTLAISQSVEAHQEFTIENVWPQETEDPLAEWDFGGVLRRFETYS